MLAAVNVADPTAIVKTAILAYPMFYRMKVEGSHILGNEERRYIEGRDSRQKRHFFENEGTYGSQGSLSTYNHSCKKGHEDNSFFDGQVGPKWGIAIRAG